MNTSEYAELLPEITDANRAFWDGCRDGELRLQVCSGCGAHRFPDSKVCPRCLSHEAEWKTVSGRGRIWSWVTMHQKYFAAFADEVPYTVIIVELDEGPRVISALVGDAAGLEIGKPVEAVFEQVAGDRVIPKFRFV